MTLPVATRILRLVFDSARPPDTRRANDADAAPEAPQIEFVAYTDDCALAGLIRVDSSRLTDLLNDADQIELVDVVVQSLRTGEVGGAERLVLPRSELCAVKAQPPRGSAARRRPTRKHAIAFGVGRYLLHGHLHSRPGADPLIDVGRRPAIIPLTDATVRFSFNGELRCDEGGVVLVNRDRVEWFRLAPESEIARAATSIQAEETAAFAASVASPGT